jgi:branched-chain amino acid transport system permease protein
LLSQLILFGVSMGCLYALIAIGFVMIWNTAAVVNFAQGESAMFGMFLAFTAHILWGLPLWVSLPLAVGGTAVIGYFTQRGLIRPILGSDPLSVIMVTIGLQILFSNGARVIWGTQPFPFPNFLGSNVWRIAGLLLSQQSITIIIIMITIAVLLHVLSQKTRFGKKLRAVAQDREIASLMGINVDQTIAYGFALSAGLAGVGGVLMAPIVFVSADIGLPLLIKSFIAAVIGGFGSYPGALIGGILIGVMDNLVGFYISTDYRDVITFLILILILIVRPEGLFPHHH